MKAQALKQFLLKTLTQLSYKNLKPFFVWTIKNQNTTSIKYAQIQTAIREAVQGCGCSTRPQLLTSHAHMTKTEMFTRSRQCLTLNTQPWRHCRVSWWVDCSLRQIYFSRSSWEIISVCVEIAALYDIFPY